MQIPLKYIENAKKLPINVDADPNIHVDDTGKWSLRCQMSKCELSLARIQNAKAKEIIDEYNNLDQDYRKGQDVEFNTNCTNADGTMKTEDCTLANEIHEDPNIQVDTDTGNTDLVCTTKNTLQRIHGKD